MNSGSGPKLSIWLNWPKVQNSKLKLPNLSWKNGQNSDHLYYENEKFCSDVGMFQNFPEPETIPQIPSDIRWRAASAQKLMNSISFWANAAKPMPMPLFIWYLMVSAASAQARKNSKCSKYRKTSKRLLRFWSIKFFRKAHSIKQNSVCYKDFNWSSWEIIFDFVDLR